MVRPLLQDAPGAVVGVRVPAGETVDGDARAGVRRVDEHPAAEIEADVAQVVEEEEVARKEIASSDGASELVLRPRVVRELDAEMLVHVAGEAGAVEAAY